MRLDGRSMLATTRPGAVMMLMTARQRAAAPPRRPRAAASTPPRTTPAAAPQASSVNTAFAELVGNLLKPQDDWAQAIRHLTTQRP